MTDAELRVVLGAPELRRLFTTVREALELRGEAGARSVSLVGSSGVERRAVADLLGWSEVPTGDRLRLRLEDLDRALRASAVGRGLTEVLVALSGPLVDRRALKTAALSAREDLWARARAQLAAVERHQLLGWLDELRAHGLLTRAANLSGTSEAVLLDRAVTAALRLPAPGVLLSVLAAELYGDAHGLDPGRPETGLVLRAATRLAGWQLPPANAVERRRLWAEVGVACDPLSTDVLTLGLRPLGEQRLARHLRECSDDGEPRRTTLRELMRTQLSLKPGTVVFVCENPSVVAAAAGDLGPASPTLVCLEGVPSTAALEALRQAAASGAELRVHADFDWAGLRICNQVASQFPVARSWRMAAADYQKGTEGKQTSELTGTPVTASWDSELSMLMSARRVALYEEELLGSLLDDLRQGAISR